MRTCWKVGLMGSFAVMAVEPSGIDCHLSNRNVSTSHKGVPFHLPMFCACLSSDFYYIMKQVLLRGSLPNLDFALSRSKRLKKVFPLFRVSSQVLLQKQKHIKEAVGLFCRTRNLTYITEDLSPLLALVDDALGQQPSFLPWLPSSQL